MNRYGYSVTDSVVETFSQCSKRQREFLLKAFDELANSPAKPADFVEFPAGVHPLSVNRFGAWLVTWWPDHPVQTVRIVDVALIQ